MLDPLLARSSILNVTLQKVTLLMLMLATKLNSYNFPSPDPHFLKKDFNQKHNAVNYIFFQQFSFQPCFSTQLLCLRLMFLCEVLNEYWKFDKGRQKTTNKGRGEWDQKFIEDWE